MVAQATSTAAGRLKIMRVELGLTQREFANRLDMDQSDYSKLERGAALLNENKIRKICNAYSVNENWLRNGAGRMFVDARLDAFDQFAAAFDLTPDQRQQIAAIVHFRLDGAPTEGQRSAARKAARILDAVNHGAIGRVSTI